MANMEKLKRDYGNVVWTGKKCILGMPISLTRYILTDTTLYTRIGLLNIKEDEIDLYRIVDKKIHLPFSQRMFFCGSIIISSKDSDTPNKVLVAIKKVREVKRLLDNLVRSERDKYHVRGRDMIGAHVDYDDDSDIDDDI
ncbi:MAG: PH domain-containing protein [Clostridiales bacterium]|nr:PH domain-containing protein [Clostridiales bacterium]